MTNPRSLAPQDPRRIRNPLGNPRAEPGDTRVHAEGAAREGREQHDPGDAFARDVGMIETERLRRDTAHRMADDHRVAQVEAFEDRTHVRRELVDTVMVLAHRRVPVAPMIERHDTKPGVHQASELLGPRMHRQRDAVGQEYHRTRPCLDHEQLAAVV